MGSHSAFLAPDGRFETLTNARLASDLRNPRVLVAVSGGPDSTALLLALREAGRDIVAAHYDHALREGSEAVARQVGELCARIGVPLITERRTEALPKGSLQAAARTLRYAFLERARIESGADAVALAHTADDVVEGSVLHLLRGCGIAGLRGMPERRGRYVRPMLGVWRSEVREFLQQRHVVPHEDPANLDIRFARVRIRREILPALERDRPGITRRFHAVALCAARLQEAAESLPTPAEAVRQLYVQAGGREPGLSRKHVEAMLKLAQPGRGGRGVASGLAASPGGPAGHVGLVPCPVPSARKVARLENPEDPRGDLS